MRNVPVTVIVMVYASLVTTAAPRPSFAQPKPDAYVNIGPVVREGDPVKGTVQKLVVTVGNQGAAPPPNTLFYATMGIVTPEGQLVCNSSGTYPNLAPGAAFQAFQFQVAYPAPLTQPGPKLAPKAGSGVTDVRPIVRSVKYSVRAHVTPTAVPCPQVDADCANNWVNRPLELPAGGTPSCVKLR